MRFLGSIHLAVGLLLVAFVGGFYTDFKANQLHHQSMRIQLGLERMLRLNQGLTSVIAMAVLEKNSLRAASYQSLQIEFDATMQEVLQLTQTMTLAGDVLALSQEQQALRTVESRVFDLMRQEKWPDAYQVLLASDYGMALKLYEINSEAAVGALSIELTNTAREHDQLRKLTLSLRLVAILLLLWAGWRYSVRLQTELAEQLRLRVALAQANTELEDKVQQRTQALEEVNHQLEVLSVTDALTRLANRRRFDAVWLDEWQRALRQATPLAVIMLDVDHFKAYNDHYGHQQGDVRRRDRRPRGLARAWPDGRAARLFRRRQVDADQPSARHSPTGHRCAQRRGQQGSAYDDAPRAHPVGLRRAGDRHARNARAAVLGRGRNVR